MEPEPTAIRAIIRMWLAGPLRFLALRFMALTTVAFGFALTVAWPCVSLCDL